MTRENVCQGTFSRITRRSRGQRHSEVGRGSTSLHARRPARVGGLEKVAGAYLQGAPAPVRSRETGSSWVLWGVLCRGGRGGGGGCGGDGVRRRWARCRRRCSGGVGRPAPVRAGRRRESRCVRAGRGPGSRPLRPRAAHPRAGPGRARAPRRQPDRTPRLIGALPGRGHGHSIPHGFRPSTTPRTIHSAPARTHRARRTARERHRDQWPSAHLTQERRHCARAGELAYQP